MTLLQHTLDLSRIRFPDNITELRPQQIEFMQAAQMVLASGRKVFFAECPTGTGKSLQNIGFTQIQDYSVAYLTGTKPLQRQIVEEFDYAAPLFGRNEYPTLDRPEKWRNGEDAISCEDCDGNADRPCSWCSDMSSCPYKVARQAALDNDVAVLNTHLWLMLQAHDPTDPFGKTGESPRDLIVLDEGDAIEQAMMGFVGCDIPKAYLTKFGLTPPDENPKNWAGWVRTLANLLADFLKRGEKGSSYLQLLKSKRSIKLLGMKLLWLEMELNQGGWVVSNRGEDGQPISFKPLMVDRYAQSYLWKHADRFLVTSGTIGDPRVLAKSMGLADDEWYYYSWPSPFPVASRPIYLWPVAKLNFKNEEFHRPAMVARLRRILEHHADDRGIIHTVSAKRAKLYADALRPHFPGRPLITYGPGEMEDAVAAYRRRPRSVIFAQSLERGMNFPDDECRFQGHVKLPYPDMNNAQVKGRMAMPGGGEWVANETGKRLCQALGRSNRHTGDFSANYVLDDLLYLLSQTTVPKYVQDAFIEGPPPWAR